MQTSLRSEWGDSLLFSCFTFSTMSESTLPMSTQASTRTVTRTHRGAMAALTSPWLPYLSPWFTAGRLLFGCCCLLCLAFTLCLTARVCVRACVLCVIFMSFLRGFFSFVHATHGALCFLCWSSDLQVCATVFPLAFLCLWGPLWLFDLEERGHLSRLQRTVWGIILGYRVKVRVRVGSGL